MHIPNLGIALDHQWVWIDLLKPFITRLLDVLNHKVDCIKVGSHSHTVLLAHPLDDTLQLFSVSGQDFNLYVVDWTIGVALDGLKLDDWAIFQANGLRRSQAEEFVYLGLREVLSFNVHVFGQSVGLSSLGWVSWEQWSFDLEFFCLVQVGDLQKNWINYTKGSWCTVV